MVWLYLALKQVICVAHSTAAMDGQQESQGPSYWVAIVKDLEQKGYYIRIVDKKVAASRSFVLGEKLM